MEIRLHLILSACIANSAWTTERSPSKTVKDGITSVVNDGTQLRHNFQNLFDSIAKNETDEKGHYREVLKQEIERGQEAYDVLEEELLAARFSSVNQKKNPVRNLYKRATYRTWQETYDRDEESLESSRYGDPGDSGSRERDERNKNNNRKPLRKSAELQGNMTREEQQFFIAVENDDVDTVQRFLREKKVSPTARESSNQTAVHLAARYGYMKTLRCLLDYDRSLLDIRDGFDYNVLHRAVETGLVNMTSCLLDEYGADLMATVHETYGNTVMHIAAAAGEIDVLKYLVEEKRLDPNLKNFYGQPAAFAAASNKKLKVIAYLAEELRANMSMVDFRNDNILFMSLMRRDMRVPRYLLEDRRVNIDINWKGFGGRTLLFLSARIRSLNFVKYLIDEKNANVSIADNEGMTPLHQAALYNNLKVVKFLVSRKAKVKVLDNNGKMPVDLAEDNFVISYLEMVMRRRGRMK